MTRNPADSSRIPQAGQVAPDFRLATAQGGEIGVRDYRGKRNLVLWFSKGLF